MVLEVVGVILAVVVIGVVVNALETKINKNNKLLDISFKESLDLTDLPVITFYNNGKKINFLLDTGANNSVINSKIIDGYAFEKSNEVGTVTGMEGNAINTSYVKMNLMYNNLLFTDSFQCVDMSNAFNAIKKESGVNIHGILGNIFFRKYKYILDFDDLKAYIK